MILEIWIYFVHCPVVLSFNPCIYLFIYRNRRSGSAAVDDSEESGIGIKTALFLIFF
jgi:hypothetical protein